MSIDLSTATAIIVAVTAMGIALYRQRQMPRIETKEQALEKRVRDLEATVRALQDMLIEKQQQIDKLRHELLEAQATLKAIERPAEQTRPAGVLLAVIGDDPALQVDLAALRKVQERTGLRFVRLLPATRAGLERILERHRKQGTPVAFVHFAVHSGPQGLELSDGLADGLWLSEHLTGVQIAVLAGCQGDVVADLLGVVPAVVSLREEIGHGDAAIFTEVFWLEVGRGKLAEIAFTTALDRCPPGVAEFAELHV